MRPFEYEPPSRVILIAVDGLGGESGSNAPLWRILDSLSKPEEEQLQTPANWKGLAERELGSNATYTMPRLGVDVRKHPWEFYYSLIDHFSDFENNRYQQQVLLFEKSELAEVVAHFAGQPVLELIKMFRTPIYVASFRLNVDEYTCLEIKEWEVSMR